MKRTDIRRGLAAVLATLTLVQGTSLAALAAEADLTEVTAAAEEAVVLNETQPVLRSRFFLTHWLPTKTR